MEYYELGDSNDVLQDKSIIAKEYADTVLAYDRE